MAPPRILLAGAAALLLMLAAVGWRAGKRAVTVGSGPTVALPREGPGRGYVTSAACRSCHPDQYRSWHDTFHRTMTQFASAGTVRAPFDGRKLPIAGGTLSLHHQNGVFSIHVETHKESGPVVRDHPIELVTGSHNMQIYWYPNGKGNALSAVPYAYLIKDQKWVPVRDTFLSPPPTGGGYEIWNAQCSQCHVTAVVPAATSDSGDAFDTRTAEMGIACEACHGPGAAHVAAKAAAATAVATDQRGGLALTQDTIVNPRRLPARLASQICGQCHGLGAIKDYRQYLREGFTYRPGQDLDVSRPALVPGTPRGDDFLREISRSDPGYRPNHYWPDGMVRVSGREWTALAASRCQKEGGLSCLSCHSMHQSDPVNQLAPAKEGRAACASCHSAIVANVAAHTHHGSQSSGSACANCHMPYTTYGLLKAIRSHLIDSPSVAVNVRTGRPNACNLCHLDQPLGWSASYLTRWYGVPPAQLTDEQQRTAAGVLWLTKGDAGQRALAAWAMGWAPARQASGASWMPSHLCLALGDSYAAVRYLAYQSLRQSPRLATLAYDFTASPADLERRTTEIARWVALLPQPLPPEQAARLLMHPDGRLAVDKLDHLFNQRDERPLDLHE